MRIYNQVRSVPSDALSTIEGGPLKGKSNINPQVRWELLTSVFGPAGECFKVEQVARWSETTPSGETAVFCEVNLYYRESPSKEWSAPVFGQGGSMLMRRSTEWVNGQPVQVVHIDDEAYKKAYTDAVSVACKALGFAADVYYRQEETKYGSFKGEAPSAEESSVAAPSEPEGLKGNAEWPWTAGLREIAPGAPNWKASVTQVSKMAGLTSEEILARITAKFNITRENFEELLRVGGRAAV